VLQAVLAAATATAGVAAMLWELSGRGRRARAARVAERVAPRAAMIPVALFYVPNPDGAERPDLSKIRY
jgi:hypothetical protein